MAVIGGGWFIAGLFKQKAHGGFIAACCIILAGALGNLIDGAFYGLVFSDSYGQIASFLPKGGGYAGFMQGQVVDMLRFPLWQGVLPHWLPFWGGEYFEFFNAIFNIADSAITIGVAVIIIFQKPFFAEKARKLLPPALSNHLCKGNTMKKIKASGFTLLFLFFQPFHFRFSKRRQSFINLTVYS